MEIPRSNAELDNAIETLLKEKQSRDSKESDRISHILDEAMNEVRNALDAYHALHKPKADMLAVMITYDSGRRQMKRRKSSDKESTVTWSIHNSFTA
jgi:hypothetical protein